MLTYEDRLRKIKSRDDLDNQIRLAGEALKQYKLKVKKITSLSDKIVAYKKIRLYDDVWYQLKRDYQEILKALGEY